MHFVDEANITVIAGNGGNGCLSFLREKFRPKGGPDGGNGGKGGSVYLCASNVANTLSEFRYKRVFKAENGRNGMGRDRAGKSGQHAYIEIPVGTLVRDAETGEIICDLIARDQKELVACGGDNGIGNACFKSSVNRTPRRVTLGKLGEERRLFLELKVLADVGLVGKPNAGKSSFLKAVSNASPKVADYPFTTLRPHLGVVDLGPTSNFVVADIPGLLAGASSGTGLGIQFLKHLSRTCILLHLVDAIGLDYNNISDEINDIESELLMYDDQLYKKERWLVFNKIDSITDDELSYLQDNIEKIYSKNRRVFFISAVSGKGCDLLKQKIFSRLVELEVAK